MEQTQRQNVTPQDGPSPCENPASQRASDPHDDEAPQRASTPQRAPDPIPTQEEQDPPFVDAIMEEPVAATHQ
jgi:hypothetical protein